VEFVKVLKTFCPVARPEVQYPDVCRIEISLKLCKGMGGLKRGYLFLDDVLIQRYRTGKLGLKKSRDTSTGAWVSGWCWGGRGIGTGCWPI
jgi:hypothetical protein